MQNIEAILTELGIEVPADKKENLTKKVSENYITKAEHEKKLGKAETDRDTWKAKAETAETTLKGFEGVDLDTMQKELSDWKKKAEDAEKDAQAKLYERDFSDALKTEGIKFSSEAAKRAIMADVKAAGLKLKDGKILGLNDLITQMKEKDASAFVNDEQQKAQQNQARFTQPANKQGQGGALTKDQIMSIKDASERQAAIAANMSLFN
ncbi:MAG: phage scaffolding protein [Dialister invisus]|uniref:phage scaffolding protein n=1 Tax=Dialister invisus TaxID=218538 RepID=UPI0039936A91